MNETRELDLQEFVDEIFENSKSNSDTEYIFSLNDFNKNQSSFR